MTEITKAIDALHRAGRSMGDTAFARPPGVGRCVSGHNGENLIRTEGATAAEAWRNALAQARAAGMLRSSSG